MLILPQVRISEDHPLTRWCRRLRIWSRPSARDGAFTAKWLLCGFWVAWTVALALTVRDPVVWLGVLGGTDVGLRVWRIRTSLLFVPVWLLAIAWLAFLVVRRYAGAS